MFTKMDGIISSLRRSTQQMKLEIQQNQSSQNFQPRFPECRGSDLSRRYLYPDGSTKKAPETEERASPEKARTKRYGQFFTPFPIALLACSAVVSADTEAIVDPMCGDGRILRAAAERRKFLHRNSVAPEERSSLLGVEVDANVATEAVRKNADFASTGQADKILRAEAFTELSHLLRQERSPQKFDAVVGNPPYVRYQDMEFLLDEMCPALVEAFETKLEGANRSEIAQKIVRASLLNTVIPLRGDSIDELADEALRSLRKSDELARRREDPLEACWIRLVEGYSGLSDLSLPSWLLSWPITSPGGRIAFVSTTTWQNREYGRPLRYFMHRFLKPIARIEQERRSWFPNADVDAALYVFEVREKDRARVPLTERSGGDHQVVQYRVLGSADLRKRSELLHQAKDMTGGSPASLPIAAHQVIDHLLKSDPEKTSRYEVNLVNEKEMMYDLMSGEDESDLLWKLEGETAQTSFHVDDRKSSQRVPGTLRRALNLPPSVHRKVRNLGEYNVQVCQGLRTGCNAFFYLQSPSDEKSKCLFGEHWPLDEINQALETPHSNMNHVEKIVRKVSEISGIVPSEPITDWKACQLVITDEEMGGMPCIFPNELLVPVVRYQSELGRIEVTLSDLRSHAFVVQNAATPEDYQQVVKKYGQDLIQLWHSEHDFDQLSSAPSEFIRLGENVTLKRNGRTVRIPEMSAVAPNSRQPSVEPGLFNPPLPPAWWYNLRIKPRHEARLFLPRVNSSSAEAGIYGKDDRVLIDANFSTFLTNGVSKWAILAMLRSTWFKLTLEHVSTPMGGGALKVEAAHIRRAPIPKFDQDDMNTLEVLGRRLVKEREKQEKLQIKIDQLVMEAISDTKELLVSKARSELRRKVEERRK
jgi:methylase of polypeptide subunit release factors